jgi:amino acid adenylation domain-containing protein
MKCNLFEYFNETQNVFSNKIAIDDNQGKITFKELNDFSNKIAVSIFKGLKSTNNPIPVFLPKSRWSVSSFIGIFKTGNFYVPLDVKSPIERISKILHTLNSECIITNRENKSKLIEIGFQGHLIIIEEILDLNISKKDVELLLTNIDSIIDLDPIYSIFTSGSTGDPKGVLISHRGVIDFIEWAITTYEVTETAIIGNQVPLYFDMSVLDIYLMVFTGATLHIIPEEQFTFPIKLIEYINEKNINFIFWVPSVLNNVSNFDAFSVIKPKFLSKILFAGEAMPNKHLNYWRNNYPNALYSNLYGPTEITVIATYYIVNRTFKDDESLPIGKACKNTQTLVISEEGKLVKKGEMGELCIRGSLLAYGYYNNSDKTKEAFVQNPLHNFYPDIVYKTGDLVYENQYDEIMFVGRKDSQIKHIGYRIELGEIETAILGIQGVRNSCVLYDDSNKQIVAFYIAEKTHIEVRKQLISTLPKYMIPTKWIKKETFSLNANGKINRLELKNQI